MSKDSLPEKQSQETFPVFIKRDDHLPPEVYHISKRDRDIVNAYIATGSTRIVSKECKIREDHVKDILARPELQSYIATRFKQAAGKYDLTEEKIMGKLNDILESDGKTKYDASFTKALELGAKILKLIQPQSVNVGVQINNPYQELPDEELDSLIEERLNGAKKPHQA